MTAPKPAETPRHAALRAFVAAHLGAQATLDPASADASFRSYWRATRDGRSWIVMDAPPAQEDIGPWLAIGARLREAGLRAPAVAAVDTAQGFVLMDDLGRDLYLPALTAERVDGLYGAALDALLAMQTGVAAGDLPPYDRERLIAEMELMPTWFLQRHLGITPACEDWDVIEQAFGALAEAALQQPQVFVHRDYHSRNLLLPHTDGRPGVLDFQDAVRGPVTYDLVSLLRDCYIAWPEAQVAGWIEAYRQRLAAAGIAVPDAARFARAVDLMGLQRHLKVLGIFCRLCYRDGKSGYLGDLPLVWHYTRSIGARHPETAALVALLEQAIGDRDLTRPREQPAA